MSEKKITSLDQLKKLATRTNAEVTKVKNKIQEIEQIGAQANVLEGVKVNGTALEIADKIVDILIATGTANGTIKVNGVDVSVAGLAAMAYKANVSYDDLAEALKTVIDGKANSADTLAGYGITDAYTMEEINSKISSVYKPAGSLAFAGLPVPSADNLGNVYNVTDAFTTSAAFVEGAGKKHPAGTNVVVIAVGEEFKFDVLAGFVDLSGYVPKNGTDRLMTEAEGTKLGNIAEGATKVEKSDTNGNVKINGQETAVYILPDTVLQDANVATDAEVDAMLDEVFGPADAEA